MKIGFIHLLFAFAFFNLANAQDSSNLKLLSIDRIFNSNEFRQDFERTIQWINGGKAYVTIEPSQQNNGADELVQYDSKTQERSLFVSSDALRVNGKSLTVESFSLSKDGSKVLIFSNSSRVWRSNTKGDYWVYDFNKKDLKKNRGKI